MKSFYDEDSALVSLAQNGDMNAFNVLLERYRKMILSIAFYLAKNEHDAYDMAQEAYVKIYRNINKFEGKSKFSTWVYRVTKNTCIDELKRINRNRKYCAETENDFKESEEKSFINLPEEEAIKNELNNYVRELLEEISPLYSNIIKLRYVSGLSYNEIAEELKCSQGTVKSRLYRGKKYLKEIIDQKMKNFMTIL